MPTIIGGVEMMFAALLLVLGSIEAMYVFVMLMTLMVGSSAIDLGSNSILPSLVGLAFLIVRVLLPGAGQMPNFRQAVASNALLLAFTAYILIGALTLPVIFKNDLMLVPMRTVVKHSVTAAFPLQFTIQNLTTAAYTFGSFMMAVVSFIAARQPRIVRVVPITAVVIIAIHVFFGIYDAVLGRTALGALTAFFRNGSYAQLDQSFGGIVRIKGIAPEPSAYASYGAIWFVFASELWLRDIRPRATGIAAAIMGLVLVASTSSTAYVALAFYAGFLVCRFALMPSMLTARKTLSVGALALALIMFACFLMLLYPDLAGKLGRIFLSVTVEKGDSSSGQDRLFLAEQGPQAFLASYGLGVGAGSFRSSSLASAIVGSAGVFGVITYAFYILHVVKPLRRSTYATRTDPRVAIGAAASWVVVVQACTASASAPSSDPGANAMLFAGLALGLRSMPRAVRRKPAPPVFPLADRPVDPRAVPAF